MIRLTRKRTVNAIPALFRGPGRLASDERLLRARRDHLVRLLDDPKASHGYPSSWWKAAKPTLRAESGGKCAYCEARADAVAHCDVEHIRPKSEWWWLTCCWENYCFACQLCNQKYKLDYYPIFGPRMKGPSFTAQASDAALLKFVGALGPDPLDDAAREKFTAAVRKEKAGLPDPYLDDPERLFRWEAISASGYVRIAARTKSTAARRALDAVEKYYGLNREELCELRYELFESLEIAREALPKLTGAARERVLARLTRYLDAKHTFAGMCRYFICDEWKLLPRPSP